jgi:hypothetical protein
MVGAIVLGVTQGNKTLNPQNLTSFHWICVGHELEFCFRRSQGVVHDIHDIVQSSL